MKTTPIASALLALTFASISLPVLSQTAAPKPAPAAAASALPLVEAEVRKVDTAAGKISLKHGEIKNLDMPPMSMVFQVSDPALLSKVKAGDKVRFTATQINGAYTVMSIEPTP